MPKTTFFAYLPPPGDPLTCSFCGELPTSDGLVVAERMQGEPALICATCVRVASWAIEDALRQSEADQATVLR